jgi:UDP-glucose 4-epimerase
LSTAKVLGERSPLGRPFTEADPPQPEDAYGRAKWAAEERLFAVAGGHAGEAEMPDAPTGMEVVVLRPPLIYGPGVRANFLKLFTAVARGLPLPLGAAHNRRSLLFVGNLGDAILTCLSHPAAAGRTYLVTDDEEISVAQLLRLMAQALGRAPRLFSVPSGLLRFAFRLIGKESVIARLTDPLELSSRLIQKDLSWSPPHTLAEGLQVTAAWYHSRKQSDR